MAGANDIVGRLTLFGKVQFPPPGQGLATISVIKSEDSELLSIEYSETNEHSGAVVYFKRSVLLQHVSAIVTFKDNMESTLPEGILRCGIQLRSKSLEKVPVDQKGIVFVVEDAPVFVESNIRESYTAFAAEEACERPGDSRTYDPTC